MPRIHKLEFDLNHLSPAGLRLLRAGFCVDEDPDHLCVSEDGFLDMFHDRYANGSPQERLDLTALFGPHPEFDVIPEGVWIALGLPAEDRAEIEALWAENPTNEVEWVG